jgi:hypothetical protein
VGEGLQARSAILGFVYFARAESMQQRAQNAPHMRIVINDQKAQAIEIDADHLNSSAAGTSDTTALCKT